MPDITATRVADAVVEHIVLRHGCPAKLLSDRGSQFMSNLFKRMSERLGIKKVFSSAYHPQTNGQVERLNRYIACALSAYVSERQDDWDDYLEAIAFAYRTSLIDAIENTPFYLVHGRDPCTASNRPIGQFSETTLTQKIREAFDTARSHQEKTDLLRKLSYDAKHHPVEFNEGSLVLLHSSLRRQGISPKLSKTYDGPYRVLQKLSDVTYELGHVATGKRTVAHVQRMIPFFQRQETEETVAIQQSCEESQEYQQLLCEDNQVQTSEVPGRTPRATAGQLPCTEI